MIRTALFLLLATSLSASPRRVIVEFAAPAAARSAGQSEVQERILARFREDLAERTPRAGVQARIRQPLYRALSGAILELPEGVADAEVAGLPNVARVTADWDVEAFGLRETPHAARALRPGAAGGGAGVTVAVIDSGIDALHPALAGKVAGGWDFVNSDADPNDDNRHGTHVAGIIAAQGETTGVAPGVSLLAYKVLDARGKGSASDIIAAIERSLDPNGDGDPSDRAGVINLSLGGAGYADDAVSRAVENAVAAGVVVCVAAGNEGAFHAIGSPGAAPSAITVGAFDDTNEGLAEFSNRGPAVGNAGLKPDVLASGVGIRSTVPGGGYLKLTGTSMATPYVSGVAALLRAAHPDWPPSRVKSAIAGTATPLLDQEVMAQGAGLVVLDRAAADDLAVQPPAIGFGLDGTAAPSWHVERTITITNQSASARTISVTRSATPAGLTVTVVPATLPLAPGASGEVRVTIDANHATLGDPPTGSLSFGGRISLQYEGGQRSIPWAFVRAARAAVRWEGESPRVMWNIPATHYASYAPLGDEGTETLVEPGTFDVAVVASGGGRLRVVVAEGQAIEGDVALAFSDADAPHEILLDALPGATTGATSLYSILARLIQPEGSITLPVSERLIRSSSFSSRYSLLTTETLVDTSARAVYMIQHPPLTALASGTTLGVPSGAFAKQDLVIHARPGSATQELRIMPRDWPRRSSEFGPEPAAITTVVNGDWKATLYFTPETHADFASGVQTQTRSDTSAVGPAWMSTPMIRRTGEGFASFRGFETPAVPVGTIGDEDLEFGAAAARPESALTAGPSGINGTFELRGDREETRRGETAAVAYTVKQRDGGQQVAAGTLSGTNLFISLPGTGAYVAELATSQLAFRGGNATAALTLGFDTRTGSVELPAFTSLAVLDGAGRHVSRLPLDGNGSLVFSAKGISSSSAGAFFRPVGKTTWVQLTPVQTGDDETVGAIYRVDLADALRFAGGIEIALEVTSTGGATASWRLAPAFVVEPTVPHRRRAAGR